MRALFRASAAFLAATALTATAAGCTVASTETHVNPPMRVSSTAPTTEPTETPGTPAEQSWPMPDLRGKVLQDAQDAMQSLIHDPVFLTRSHDVTGRGRHQILDRDWQVCTQNVAPGTMVTLKSQVDFGVVRVRSEQCP